MESRVAVLCVVSCRPSVDIPARSEVKSASGLERPDVGGAAVQLAIAATLHQIDFAGHRPASVDGMSRHQPERRPQPIASRRLRADLNNSITEAEGVESGDAATSNRVDDVVGRALSVTAVPF